MSSHFFAFNEIKQVVCDSEDAFYPASNLLEHPTYKEFRSSGPSAAVVLDLGRATTCDSLLLCGNNATSSLPITRIILRANPFNNNWESPAFEQELEVTNEHQIANLFYTTFTKTSFRYWMLLVENLAGDYVGFSNIFLGCRTELYVDLGCTFTSTDRSQVDLGRYGQRFIDKLPSTRTLECTMSVMNQTERDAFEAIVHRCGSSTPLWVVLRPEEGLNEAGYCYFSSVPTFENQSYQLYNTSFTLEEVV